MRANTPPNWVPPFEAYEAKYDEDTKPLAVAYVGVQDRGGDAQTSLQSARALLSIENGPDIIEQGWSSDVPGAHMHILMAYWRHAEAFANWRASAELNAWLTAGSDPLIGRWIETSEIRPRALDTLIADTEVNWGVAKLADEVVATPYHAYWGGTRDRILLSETDALESEVGLADVLPRKMPAGVHEIIDVVLPENAVFTRGGPDWSQCPPDEMQQIRNSVYPAYVAGGRYLRDNPEESGCYACYFIQETDEAGNDVQRNHQIGYFVELSKLEDWTKNHPTHKAIFGRFMSMMTKLSRPPQMNLYHEVSPIAAGGLRATYVNCLPETGLLRYGQVRGEADAS
ncbi:MAG: phenylacetaldoxime dehydratase family protein [Pseudomonadota bacterium]